MLAMRMERLSRIAFLFVIISLNDTKNPKNVTNPTMNNANSRTGSWVVKDKSGKVEVKWSNKKREMERKVELMKEKKGGGGRE
jgi:hypothetical protein